MLTTEGDSFSARSENVSGASNALTDPLPKIKKDTKIDYKKVKDAEFEDHE